jgi:glucose-1-phosphate cytidylyltransferase
MNGGYFIFKNEIFNYLKEGEELILDPFQRLIQKDELIAYKYNGFWACMDTFKDKQMLDDVYTQGSAPWEIWKNSEKLV